MLLVLMVRNEEQALPRCLEAALPHADAVLLADTGSTDETIGVAKTTVVGKKPLRVVQHEWRDFGHNRTLSLKAARDFAEELGWNKERSLGLVLDADMVLVVPDAVALRSRLDATPPEVAGFMLIQKNSSIEYANMRFMRLSQGWYCAGVTHEYWTGESGTSETLPLSLVYIDDIGDGGCKDDKFERDERLLLQGLREDPSNVRYMFYLAQTYHCLNRHEEAIKWYAKRIAGGGWAEEVFYAGYMKMMNHLRLEQYAEAEAEAMRTHKFLPDRAEVLAALVTSLRDRGEHHKAWHYLKLAERIPAPTDARLFGEPDVYQHKLLYERSILSFYVESDKTSGMKACVRYLGGPLEVSVLSNMKFYTQRLGAERWKRLEFPCAQGYRSSSICVNRRGVMAVRTVNYDIRPDGSYIMADGKISTRNYLSQWLPGARMWVSWRELHVPSSIPKTRIETIHGLEDLRIDSEGRFTATTREYSYCEWNRMACGTVDPFHFEVARPPTETTCEKNWIPLDDGRIVYKWHPFQAGVLDRDDPSLPPIFKVTVQHEMPKWFRHVRGSSTPFVKDSELWFVCHLVVPEGPRKYLHLLVLLDKDTLKLTRFSLPFYFREIGIEYCMGAQYFPDFEDREPHLEFFVSSWDRESWVGQLPMSGAEALLLDASEDDLN